jgi:mRNA interferase HigB
MHVITRRRILEFGEKYPDSQASLNTWYRLMDKGTYGSFTELKKIFASADKVGNKVVFDIGGNKYRLIAVIHFNRGKVYIRHVLTHKEYDKGAWK